MDEPVAGDWAARRLAAIVESSLDAIISKDLNGVVTSWNAGAEVLFGYSAEEMIGTSILPIIPSDRHDEEAHILSQIRRGEVVAPFDTQRRAKDGRLIDVSVTASPIRDAHDATVGVSKIARDISQRIRAQAAQRASDARYRTLFEHAPEGIVIADPNSYYLDANAAMCSMLGYTRDEFIGLHASNIVSELEQPQVPTALEQIFTEGHYQRDWHFRRKDGSSFIGDVRVTTLPDGNLLGIIRDITERQEAERRIRYLNRTYAVLSDVNQMIVRLRNPEAVLQTACEIAVGRGQFRMAWIGMVDERTGAISPVASAGVVEGYLDRVPLALRQDVRDPLPAAGAIATGVRQVHNDIAHEAVGSPWRLEGLRRGYRAVAAFPLVVQGSITGAFALYASEPAFFNDEELRLLDELVMDIGFALEMHGREIERQRVDQALRDERNRAQRYLDTADVLLLALDVDGRITVINRKGCELLGYSEAELLGQSWIDTCLPQRTRQELAQTFDRLLAGDVSVVENPILTKNGEERLLEWRSRVLRDETGVIGTFSSGTDITERKRAEHALRVAEERMRFVLENAKVGLWNMDYHSGRLVWSEQAECHYGVTPGSFEGTFDAFVERVHPDDRGALLDTIGKAMRVGTDFSTEHRACWPDGAVRWLSGFGRVLLDSEGRPAHAVGITLDVTERHSLEAQYHQAQKMEAIGRLAGGVAHDFNNLLTAILGYCELMLEGLNPRDPMHADLTEIQRAGTTAAALTRQLLAFSRKQIIEPRLVDLNIVSAEMHGMLCRLIGEDVAIAMTLAAEPAWVSADRGQLEQVLLNLAVNARDAMPTGGALTIETAHVDLDDTYASAHFAVKPGSYVALVVTDTGTGMTPDVQARLFEPFFTTKEQGKGTGLGLASVHGIVSQTGGSVSVYSEIGRGTSFTAYFPRADATQIVPDAPAEVPHPRVSGRTVLVVEDADGLRELTRRLLTRQGYRVLVAANADEATRLFEHHASIDVLLTDVIMPGASGPELTRQLIEQRPGLKVIYMSGYTEDAIVRHGVLKSGIAFLHKPFNSHTLETKIREALEA